MGRRVKRGEVFASLKRWRFYPPTRTTGEPYFNERFFYHDTGGIRYLNK